MPYGGTTPAQDKKIERCVSRLTAGGREKSSAIAICKSSVMKGESLEDLEKSLKEGEKKLKKKKKTQEAINETFSESLVFSFNEENIDEESRTVRVCALAPCISKNNRYYSPQVVESIAGSLSGKKSFADHDQRDTKNLVGRIVNESLEKGRVYADIRISKAGGVAKQTWQKILDGTITDVSIAADGKTKRVKIGDVRGDEVTELDVKSVDFVTEGGVAAAKVMRVFESTKDLPEISEVKEEMIIETLEQLKEQYPDFVVQIEEKLKDEVEALKKERDDLKFKLVERELAEYKKIEIDKLETSNKLKDILRKRVSGKTKDELAASLKQELEYAKIVLATTEEKATSGPEASLLKEKKEKEKKDTTPWTQIKVKEDARIPEEHKLKACEILTIKGSEPMIEFLKGVGIEL